MPAEVTVWDSSVLIPLILPASKSSALFSRLDNAGWIVAVTPAILEEVREKLQTKPTLRRWLGLDDVTIGQFVDIILPALVRVFPGVTSAVGAVPADPDDDKVVAAAIESHATYVISEDQHLLNLAEYDGIKILNRDSLRIELDRLGVP